MKMMFKINIVKLYIVFLYVLIHALCGLHTVQGSSSRWWPFKGNSINDNKGATVAIEINPVAKSADTGGEGEHKSWKSKLVDTIPAVVGILDPLLRKKGDEQQKGSDATKATVLDSGDSDEFAETDDDEQDDGQDDGQGESSPQFSFLPALTTVRVGDAGTSLVGANGATSTGMQASLEKQLFRLDPKILFELYSNKESYKCIINGVADEKKLNEYCPQFNCQGDVAVMTHGMTNPGYTPSTYLWEKDNLINRFDNAIFFDWSDDSYITKYPLAVNQRDLLGKLLGDFLLLLHKVKQLNINRLHMMGYSMGAHIVAFASRRVQESLDTELPFDPPEFHKVGIVTAFDAASPLISRRLFLRKKDAHVVQAIHTSNYFGITTPIGHFDYFPNGGNNQPGCPGKSIWHPSPEKVTFAEVCDHNYSIPIALESFRQDSKLCQFVGYPCEDYDTFLNGACPNCARVAVGMLDCHRLAQRPVMPHKLAGDTPGGERMFFISGRYPKLCTPNYHLKLVSGTKFSSQQHEEKAQKQFGGHIGKWIRGTFTLKVELVINKQRFAVYIDGSHKDKILQKVIMHSIKLDKTNLDSDSIDPVQFEKIIITNQDITHYQVDRIEVTYMSHSKKEVRDKYSAVFEMSKQQDSSQPARTVYLKKSGY